jgi:cysteine sulfinate desulfinase/cysteine desulfurase-like protein
VRPEDSRGSLRLSLSKFNTMEEAERFLGAIGEIVARLRSMAPRAARSGGA